MSMNPEQLKTFKAAVEAQFNAVYGRMDKVANVVIWQGPDGNFNIIHNFNDEGEVARFVFHMGITMMTQVPEQSDMPQRVDPNVN